MRAAFAADPQVYRRRQEALKASYGSSAPALLFAGWPRPRNYRASTFRFRADSSFFYFIGQHLPGAVFALLDGQSCLFVSDPPPGDELWHGPSPTHQELQERCAVDRVASRSEFEQLCAQGGFAGQAALLPCTDPLARLDQAARFGRSWTGEADPQELESKDAALAQLVIDQRLVHDQAAIAALRHSCGVTVQAHRAGMRATAPGGYEYQVLAAIVHEMGRHDAFEAYSSICSVQGQVLHHCSYDNRMAQGDLLLVDAGAEAQGWASDVTRTWPVSGKFSATQRAIYDIVLQSQKDGIDKVRTGVRFREVHLQCAKSLTQGLVDEGVLRGEVDSLVQRGAHALFFPHGTGHLLGLDVHDMENFGDRAGYAPGRSRSDQFGLAFLRLDRDLQPGMAVTVEPGFYQVPALLEGSELVRGLEAEGAFCRETLAKFSDVKGIRIEDDVLCTQGDPEVMTGALEREASEIEALMG